MKKCQSDQCLANTDMNFSSILPVDVQAFNSVIKSPIEVFSSSNQEVLAQILLNLQKPEVNQWLVFGSQFLLAFLGAGFAFVFAIWLAKQQRVSATTEALINEFSSRDMLKSRFVTVGISDQVKDGSLDLKEIAKSSLQDCPKGFIGVESDGFTEHQHMSHVIGFYRKLALSFRYKWVLRNHIKQSIGGSLQWTLPFLLLLADEVEKISKEFPSERSISERASWIFAVRYINNQLNNLKKEISLEGCVHEGTKSKGVVKKPVNETKSDVEK